MAGSPLLARLPDQRFDGTISPLHATAHLSVPPCLFLHADTQVLVNWTVMFSDLHEKHIPEIGSNGSNFTADFCESGAFGAELSVLVGLKLALLNPVYFASPNCTIKSGAHVSQASRHDFLCIQPTIL